MHDRHPNYLHVTPGSAACIRKADKKAPYLTLRRQFSPDTCESVPVFFSTAANLISALTKAYGEGRLDERLKFYTTPHLLIIDEIGYLPIDRLGANLFFQLISRRYERGPMILTSNQSFGASVPGARCSATA